MTNSISARSAFRRFAPLLLLFLLASGCSDDSDTIVFGSNNGENEIIEFQDGVLPDPRYIGTSDAFLKDGPGLDNYNFGHMSYDTVGSRLLTDSYYESRFIVRIDIAALTDCSEIVRAELYLHLSLPSADSLLFEAYEVTVPQVLPGTWLEGVGGPQGGVSWLDVDGSVPWDTKGGDIVGVPFDSATVAQDSVMMLEIPNELAFRWIEDPLSNHGIVVRLVGTMPGEHIILHTRESDLPPARPRLLIEYIPGG